jgi:hypothetical protein
MSVHVVPREDMMMKNKKKSYTSLMLPHVAFYTNHVSAPDKLMMASSLLVAFDGLLQIDFQSWLLHS